MSGHTSIMEIKAGNTGKYLRFPIPENKQQKGWRWKASFYDLRCRQLFHRQLRRTSGHPLLFPAYRSYQAVAIGKFDSM